ncbi:MAG TPA: hypothetical protein VMH31_06600 [Methylomirabilota bacterium]|nr:hypothetical protein [Methylomirabilota bacterium]
MTFVALVCIRGILLAGTRPALPYPPGIRERFAVLEQDNGKGMLQYTAREGSRYGKTGMGGTGGESCTAMPLLSSADRFAAGPGTTPRAASD